MSTKPPSNARPVAVYTVPMVQEIEIKGPDIETLVLQALEYIRPNSRAFYRREIRKDLLERGRTIVDRHAANGRYLKISLEK